MLDQEACPLHRGLLADTCGLGKTLGTLALIWTASAMKRITAATATGPSKKKKPRTPSPVPTPPMAPTPPGSSKHKNY
ncbi:Helicase C-terminal [Penicillium odoratum]|uniref:Helicase C-terminal n=1 Tax=Penicillium odoratum TaxID=1167516 RepID=UPI0025480BDC|nr:Helicase C-terminal [Penicillium odoratum]KAJ5758792.1 Helicase C-terminal [Penicillium odoratum]